jgi:hypothetical protein
MNKKTEIIIVKGNLKERLKLVNAALKVGWKFDGDVLIRNIQRYDYLCFNIGDENSGGNLSIKYLHFWGCESDESEELEEGEIYMDFAKSTFKDILAAINIDDIIMSNKTIEDI